MQEVIDIHPVGSPAEVIGAPVFPLKHSANKRYLVDQNNVPFLIHGDTMWMWQICRSFSASEQVEVYLEDRKCKGFTAIQFHALICKDKKGTIPDFNNEMPFLKEMASGSWRLDSPNQTYFDTLKWIVAECNRRGMLAIVSPLWLGSKGSSKGWWQEIADSSNDDAKCSAFGQYLGEQFADYDNIIWIHGGDRAPNSNEIRRCHEIMKGIKSRAPQSLHTAHWFRPPNPDLARANSAFRNDIDVEMVYAGTLPYFGCLNSWNNILGLPPIPAFMGESYYEDSHFFPSPSSWPACLCRREAYWSLLSGAGHIYGLDHPIFPTGLNTPGAQDMVHVKNAFHTRAWYNLVPDTDHTVVTKGWGVKGVDAIGSGSHADDTYVTAARTTRGNLVMAYLPPTGTATWEITVNMTKLSRPTIAKWYDPTTGVYTPISDNPIRNSGSRTFTSPGNNGDNQNDWVLILEV